MSIYNKILLTTEIEINSSFYCHTEWVIIRDVLIRARERFCYQSTNTIMVELDISSIQVTSFTIHFMISIITSDYSRNISSTSMNYVRGVHLNQVKRAMTPLTLMNNLKIRL